MQRGRTLTAEDLLEASRCGDQAALGELLERVRPYMTLLAGIQIGKKLRIKADPEDVVQETFLQAQRRFETFRGRTGDEFIAWLQEVLASRLAKLVRRYLGTQSRDIRLEQNISRHLHDSSRMLDRMLMDRSAGPVETLSERERAVVLASALDRLSEDHRRVLMLRHLDGLSFAEVGERMGRTPGAATQLWSRAIVKLREVIGP